ncbi:hypothetical protein BWQ96_08680 [Gracilariopsis chorda]|uniref:Uncharacterized protein n=1 Tax=Gracilariopsis chorda TaxID=448386 RepID=A0A2V3IHU0_9FLOR|nr:hypothetical protein BWQ96_08680 [Gracilariopsis chorda]|eukprot:PXF41593.1 hypothetical protein BWQ96_08680 [Gracilariopsis chorda]
MDEERAEKLIDDLPIRIAALSLEHFETRIATGENSRAQFNNLAFERAFEDTESDAKRLHANLEIVQDQLMRQRFQERRTAAILVQKVLRGRESPFQTVALQKEHWNKIFSEIFIMARQIRVRNIRTDRAAVVYMWYLKVHYTSKHVRRVKTVRLSGGIHKTNHVRICVREKESRTHVKL